MEEEEEEDDDLDILDQMAGKLVARTVSSVTSHECRRKGRNPTGK